MSAWAAISLRRLPACVAPYLTVFPNCTSTRFHTEIVSTSAMDSGNRSSMSESDIERLIAENGVTRGRARALLVRNVPTPRSSAYYLF